jgi:hypothetical protein
MPIGVFPTLEPTLLGCCPGSDELFLILLLRTLGFSDLVSQDWASPVWYYNSPANTHLSRACISMKSRLRLDASAPLSSAYDRSLAASSTCDKGSLRVCFHYNAYRSTGSSANGVDCPCLATPKNVALIVASYTRVGACRSVAPYDNGTTAYGSTTSEHNAATTPPGAGRERC